MYQAVAPANAPSRAGDRETVMRLAALGALAHGGAPPLPYAASNLANHCHAATGRDVGKLAK